MDLLERLKESRQSKIAAGAFEFSIRRPTDMEAITMQYTSTKEAVLGVMRFVNEWKGVTEADVVPGGTGDSVPFDADLFAEWVQDRPELWSALIDGVLDAYTQHREAQETEGKP
ncbi:MAG: hypothetical protein GY927_16080 [bacterium]|nr:hypothetical protein [bacterium]